MANYKEMLTAWDKAGRPRDMDGLHDVLMQFMEHGQAQEAFKAIGMNLPDSEPEEPFDADPYGDKIAPPPERIPDEQLMPSEEEPEVPQYEIPIGYTITSKTGKEFTWKGAQWVSKGRIVPKEYRPKIDAAAQRSLHRDELQRQQDEIDAKAAKDAEYAFDDDPVDTPEMDKKDGPSKEHQQQAEDPTSTATANQSESKLASYARQIKASGNAERIKELLAQGDPLADEAADILMRGREKLVAAELSSLNSDK